MRKIFENGTDGLYWFFDTSWDIWSSLFAPLPYGDPYVAALAAALVFFFARRVINPRYRIY